MTITDILALILCFFLLWRGTGLGFIGSLLGPLALIIASIVSIVYFAWTKNLPVSLCIGLFGPFILAWIFRFFLRSWTKVTNPQGQLSMPSRLGGALLTWGWGMIMYAITLLLLTMLPTIYPPLEPINKDVHASLTYQVIKPFDFYASDDRSTAKDDIKTLSEDQRIQDIINDPDIIKAIQNKNFASLTSNPKMMKLIQDPALIKRMLRVHQQQLQEQKTSQ